MVNKHDDIQRSILYLKHIDLHILSYIHTSNEMHSKACAHACAHAHMRMRTMSTFDRIDLLAWIGTAQIVPICFDTTHVLFDVVLANTRRSLMQCWHRLLKIAAYSQINFHQSQNGVVTPIYVPKQQNNIGACENWQFAVSRYQKM